MNFNTSELFDKQAKKLSKKYRSIATDLSSFIDNFDLHHQSSTLIKNSLYKVRIKNSDKNRGKSGGYRVYYYIKSQENIYLLTIYDKSEIESINEEILTELIEGILKYEE